MQRGLPGHMQKGRLAIAKYAKVLDCCLLVLDSRAPCSTWDPKVAKRFSRKLLVVLNRADLAEPEKTRRWEEHFKEKGYAVEVVDAKSGTDIMRLRQALESRVKGTKPLRVAVLGLPNTGKSTILNRLIGRRASRVENRPGVTRGPQWVRVGKLEILDTPGIVSKKADLENPILAALGLVAADSQMAAEWLLERILIPNSPALTYFGLQEPPKQVEELSEIAKSQGWLRQGGQPDLARAAQGVLAAFQNGKLGRWTLEEA